MKKFLRLIFVSLSCVVVLGEPLLASQALVRKDIEFDEMGDAHKKVRLSQGASDSEVPEAPFVFENTTSSVSSAVSTEFLWSAVDIGLLGYIDALLARGKEHLIGTSTVPQDFDKAFQCFKKVAAYGNADALHELGILYFEGKGVDKNLDKALELFTRAAQLGIKPAYKWINSIGVRFSTGEGVARDYKRAVSCFEQAIQASVPEAYYDLGVLYFNGNGVEKNLDKALELFTQAAQLGDKPAYEYIDEIGVCLCTGAGVVQDYKKAVSCFEQAIQGRFPGSYYNLGVLYVDGQGVEKNFDKALELFTQAAQLGDKPAYEYIDEIGVCFGIGAGVAQDYKKAVSCFEQAIQGGVPGSYYNLGALYVDGQGVERNFDKALELFTTAAQLGYKAAYEPINEIGVCFGTGRGVAQDYKKAVSCYERAIAGKNPLAYHNLGALYFNGNGVEKNLDKALELFTQSADLGCQDACAMVYHCFAKGIRVQKDEKKAAAYLKTLAETLGEQEAKKRVDERIHRFLSGDPKINCVGEMSVCPICTNKFTRDGTITILVCGVQALHIFCKDCLDQWRETRRAQGRPFSCPCCRSTNAPIFQGHAF